MEEELLEGICKTCTKRDEREPCSKIPMNMTDDFSCEEYEHDGTCETCTVQECDLKEIPEVEGCCEWKGLEVN